MSEKLMTGNLESMEHAADRIAKKALRDQLAMAALTGLLSNVLFKGRSDIAAEAYAQADAVLAARTPIQEAE